MVPRDSSGTSASSGTVCCPREQKHTFSMYVNNAWSEVVGDPDVPGGTAVQGVQQRGLGRVAVEQTEPAQRRGARRTRVPRTEPLTVQPDRAAAALLAVHPVLVD